MTLTVNLRRAVVIKRVKVAHSRLPSVGFRLIPVLGSHPECNVSHKPGGKLPLLSARPAVPPHFLRELLPVCCSVNRGTMGVNSLPKTVTRQRRDCDLNPGSSAPEFSTLTTWLPSHPSCGHTHAIYQDQRPKSRVETDERMDGPDRSHYFPR